MSETKPPIYCTLIFKSESFGSEKKQKTFLFLIMTTKKNFSEEQLVKKSGKNGGRSYQKNT